MFKEIQDRVTKQIQFDISQLDQIRRQLILPSPVDLSYLDKEITEQMLRTQLMEQIREQKQQKTKKPFNGGQNGFGNNKYGKGQYMRQNNNYQQNNIQQNKQQTIQIQIEDIKNDKQIEQNEQNNIFVEQNKQINNKQDEIQVQEQQQQIQEQNDIIVEDNKQQLYDITEDTQWLYIDNYQKIQGPFQNSRMKKWYDKNYLRQNLLIKIDKIDKEFIELSEKFQQIPFQGKAYIK